MLEFVYLRVLFKGFPGPLNSVPGGGRFNDPGRSQDYNRTANPVLRENQLRLQKLKLEAGRSELIPIEQVKILIGAAKGGMSHDLTYSCGSLWIFIFLGQPGDACWQPLLALFWQIKGFFPRKSFFKFVISHLFPPGG